MNNCYVTKFNFCLLWSFLVVLTSIENWAEFLSSAFPKQLACSKIIYATILNINLKINIINFMNDKLLILLCAKNQHQEVINCYLVEEVSYALIPSCPNISWNL